MNETLIKKIAQKVRECGGTAYYVGGCVRDAILGIDNKDIDIEIHGVEQAKLEKILDECGKRLEFGKSFGIYNLGGENIDIAIPRSEVATGKSHRDFEVSVNPFIGTYKAAKRRDFTVNSIMRDVLSGEITDHFGGLADLDAKILRHVDDKSFGEDSLRVLRGAQFAARFGFSVAEETVQLCRSIDLSTLSAERIFEELKKAMLKSNHPSVFFEVLRKMNGLGVWFPEIEALIGVEQNPEYHPEGDCWVHTMEVIDAASEYRSRVAKPLNFMLSALCHDLGKPLTTQRINGVIHAYGHELSGIDAAKSFMKRITNEKEIIRYVLNMTELHMQPNIIFNAKSSIKSSNRMFDKSCEPTALIYLALSDAMTKSSAAEKILLERYEIFSETMKKPYVTGRDLINAGLLPNEDFSQLLDYAHKLRLAGVDKESALKQTLAYKRK